MNFVQAAEDCRPRREKRRSEKKETVRRKRTCTSEGEKVEGEPVLRLRGGGMDPDQDEGDEDDSSSIDGKESSSMAKDDKEAAMKMTELDKDAKTEEAIGKEAMSKTAKHIAHELERAIYSNDKEDDDEGMINSKQEKRNPNELSSTGDEDEAIIKTGDGKDTTKEAEIDKKTMMLADLEKEAMSHAGSEIDKEQIRETVVDKEVESGEDETETRDVNEANCEAGDDKDAGRQKRTRRECQ